MDLVPDDGTEGFSFIWTIENFSYCLQKNGEVLSSPRFKLYWSDTVEWKLKIYPRGFFKDDSIGVFLYVHSSGPFPIKVNKHLSIRAINGTFKRHAKEASTTYEKEIGKGSSCFLSHTELFKGGEGAFLDNDKLTLRCRIWKDDPDLPVAGECFARTVIDVKQIAFVWTLENFEEFLRNGRRTIDFGPISSKDRTFNIVMTLSTGIYNERKIQVEIKRDSGSNCFLTCKVLLLDADGKNAHSVQEEHWFLNSPVARFSFIPVKKVLDNDKFYLVNGALSLSWELAVSNGEKYNEVERVKYGVTEKNNKENSTVVSSENYLLKVFKEGKFSDLIIQMASGKEFPVHKAILCARSEVFSAMFEHDTKENQTGVVEIEDLNEDTISKMLLFIYADKMAEDLEWQTAELYFAGDKYAIVALKRECSTFLKGNLNCSNVCDVLVMADMHQDQDLKSAGQDFVMDHAANIINSENWKKLIQDKPNLAAETMHLLCMKKLKTELPTWQHNNWQHKKFKMV